MGKEVLKTVRFQSKEGKIIDEYLQRNPVFESFSSLARVATLVFIEEAGSVGLNPVQKRSTEKRPSFLWEYNLTEAQVWEILESRGLNDRKRWLIERILSQARFDEVVKYLDLETITVFFPRLRLPSKIKQRWEYALQRWSRDDKH